MWCLPLVFENAQANAQCVFTKQSTFDILHFFGWLYRSFHWHCRTWIDSHDSKIDESIVHLCRVCGNFVAIFASAIKEEERKNVKKLVENFFY